MIHEVERILVASEANGYQWHYDANLDAYVVRHEDDPGDYDPQEYLGTTVTLQDGNSLRVYAIGAYCWTWSEVKYVEE